MTEYFLVMLSQEYEDWFLGMMRVRAEAKARNTIEIGDIDVVKDLNIESPLL